MDRSRLSEHWRSFLNHKMGFTGLTILCTFTAIAILAPLIAPFDPAQQVGRPFQPPGNLFWLGTNDIGQDILSELIYGARVSLTIGALAALTAIVIGTLMGVMAGYYGGRIESLIMRFVDLMLVIPFLPLMILLAAYLGTSFWNLIMVIGLLSWARPARVIRSQVLSVKTRGYVQAARSMGAGAWHMLKLHILPAVLPLAVAQFVLAASSAILIEASLSFLGLGDPITKSWGSILYYAQVRSAFLTGAWVWWVLPPGLLITLVVLGFAFAGYALEEIFNPRLRKG
jgi:peptide/nickel transport system permease protein